MSGVRIPAGTRFFLSSNTCKQPLGPTLSPKQYVSGFFLGVKETGA